ncbi:cyclic nucleotide-binding protein [Alkalispirillum mobile]|uniref:Cyclic nucleotide-binding protein n=1 Tax=Alkalispirillum mobile TaxID=85925 RepID=A0A498CAZ1_9GAMM|nr:Crp/Fnr family transcriptional regulator [Alkalispirillum mobile]RLK50150.1 cyclic nucleotide-binding protein [Alkalispirillum mobile]
MTKAQIKQMLADQAFFEGLDDAVLDLLAGHAGEKSLDKDEVLFERGDPASHFYLLQDGRITIEVPAIEGPSLEVQNLEAGEILGWSWLIPPFRWSFQARAEAPTRLVEFDGETIREQCEKHPELGYIVLKRFASLMSERLDAARRRMMDEWNPPGFA